MPYPTIPGYRDTDTSKAAAASAKAATLLQQRALAALAAQPLTSDEVADVLNESILTIRPRITELKRRGLVADIGLRRPNSSGRTAIVYAAA